MKFTPTLTQGRYLKDLDDDSLCALESWLCLWEHLMRHGEVSKAISLGLVVPWDLVARHEILRYRQFAENTLKDNYGSPVTDHIYQIHPKDIPEVFKHAKQDPELQWIMDKVIATGGKTLLDAYSILGELAVEIAKMGSPYVVGMAPHEPQIVHAKEIAKKGELPLDFLQASFWEHEFSKNDQYDIVVLRGCLRLVSNPVSLIYKAQDLASKAVIITEKLGPTEVVPDALNLKYFSMRAYSHEEFIDTVAPAAVEVIDNRFLCAYLKETEPAKKPEGVSA